MNWMDIKEEETPMWMKIFKRFRSYIQIKDNRRRRKKGSRKKKLS